MWGGHIGFKKLSLHVKRVCEKCTIETSEKKNQREMENGLDGSYTYVYMSIHICQRFSSFRIPVTFDLPSQTRSGVRNGTRGKARRVRNLECSEGERSSLRLLMCKSIENCYDSLVNKTGSGPSAPAL